MQNSLLNTYNPLPIQFTHGDGVWLYDTDKERYLDAFCGIAVTGLGHNHPALTKVIKQQAAKLLHVSNLVQIPQQLQLAALLTEALGADMGAKVFFGNSGAEAVEAALKLCRLYGHAKNIDIPTVIVMEKAFHGRTMAALTASGNKKIQTGFDPLVPGFIRVPYNDAQAVQTAINNHDNIVAVLLEPIQGEGGINVPAPEYLSSLRKICDQNQLLLIIDEVQTGMARTGKLFAFQHSNITPDAVVMAKGLANGIPIGACAIRDKFCDLFTPGSHGSTFGGNPLSAAAGVATLEAINNNQLWQNAAKQGEALIDGLKQRLHNHPHVVEIRGKGLMLGIELDKPCRDILHLALRHNIIFNITKLNTIRLLPPLIIESKHVEQILEVIPKLINKFYSIPQ